MKCKQRGDFDLRLYKRHKRIKIVSTLNKTPPGKYRKNLGPPKHLFIYFKTALSPTWWLRGLMDKASDFGSEDCGFDSRRGRIFFPLLLFFSIFSHFLAYSQFTIYRKLKTLTIKYTHDL